MRALGVDAPQGVGVVDVDSRGAAKYVTSKVLPTKDRAAMVAMFDAMLAEYRPELVALEKVDYVYDREGFGTRMAGNLYESGWGGGILEGVARLRGYRVEVVEAAEVRRAFGIRARKGKADEMIRAFLPMRVAGWPTGNKTCKHRNDGGLAALFVAERARLAGRGVVSVAAPVGLVKRSSHAIK